MFNPHRTALLANISKSFTDQGLDPPDPALFKDAKGKPLPSRLLRRMARGIGVSLSEKQARGLMEKEPEETSKKPNETEA